jgi:hypothetical protein
LDSSSFFSSSFFFSSSCSFSVLGAPPARSISSSFSPSSYKGKRMGTIEMEERKERDRATNKTMERKK